MQFNFADFNPVALIALIPVVPALMGFRKDKTGVVRVVLVFMMSFALFTALSGMVRFSSYIGTCHVFLIDRSGSAMMFQDAVRESFDKTVGNLRENSSGSDLALLCVYADGNSVSGSPVPLDKLAWPANGFAFPKTEATALQEALEGTLALVPAGYLPQVWILGDGTSDSGDITLAENIPVRILNVSFPIRDAAVTRFSVHPKAVINEPIRCRITVFSETSAPGIIRLHETVSGSILDTAVVDLVRGEQVFMLNSRFTQSGYKSLLAEIEIEDDGVPENNTLKRFIQVSAAQEPYYLVIGDPIQGLKSSRAVSPEKFNAYSLEQISTFSAVVLHDVEYPRLTEKGAILLAKYVLQAGGGLIAAGSSRLFGAGEYKGSVIEDVLPLASDPRNPEKTSRRIMIAVDTSGSMDEELPDGSGKKINGAKAAALNFILERENESETGIGLLFFSSEVTLVKKPDTTIGEELLKKEIKRVTPHGGTRILPALQESLNILKSDLSKEEDRYLFMITDGITREELPENTIADVTRAITESGIGLLVLNIGGPGQSMLEHLCDQTKGRYVELKKGEQLTVSFSREAEKEMSEILFSGETVLSAGPGYTVIGKQPPSGIVSRGYIRTSLQNGAFPLLVNSENDDPVAAVRFSGAGRSAAFTGLIPGRETEILSSLLTWVGRDKGRMDYTAVFERQRDGLTCEFNSIDTIPPGTGVVCRIKGDGTESKDIRLVRSTKQKFISSDAIPEVSGEFTYMILLNGNPVLSGKSTADYSAEYNPILRRTIHLNVGAAEELPYSAARSHVPFLLVFLGVFILFEIYSVIILSKK